VSDPAGEAAARGRALAAFWREASAPLFAEIAEAVPFADAARARREWDCLAAYAGVRALVAAGGFGEATADAVDAFHDALFEDWSPAAHDDEEAGARRALLAERYGVYGAIARGADAHEAETAGRLGVAVSRRMAGPAGGPEATLAPEALARLAAIAGDLHLALVEACVEKLKG